MKLTEYAGVFQMIEPEVGMGATIYYWSDRHACTIVDVSKNGKTVTVTKDTATLTNPDELKCYAGGFMGHVSGTQKYSYKSNPDGPTTQYSLRKNGRWIRVGQSMRSGTCLKVGQRSHYYDYNF